LLKPENLVDKSGLTHKPGFILGVLQGKIDMLD